MVDVANIVHFPLTLAKCQHCHCQSDTKKSMHMMYKLCKMVSPKDQNHPALIICSYLQNLYSLFITVEWAKFHLSSNIIGEVTLYTYANYYPAGLHIWKWTTWIDKIILSMVALERWHAAHLRAERMVDILALVLWIYRTYSSYRATFSLKQHRWRV